MQMTVGGKIREARKTAGLSQQELAERLNVRQKDISRWENGVYTPNLEIFTRICQELHASADEILGLKGRESGF